MPNTGPLDSDRITALESRVQALEDVLNKAVELAKQNPILSKFVSFLK